VVLAVSDGRGALVKLGVGGIRMAFGIVFD